MKFLIFSLGFLGLLLARDSEAEDAVRRAGPMMVLNSVTMA